MELLWAKNGYAPTGLLRGLIQLAVALEHTRLGNREGALKVLAKARANLREAGPGILDLLKTAEECVVSGKLSTIVIRSELFSQ